MADFLRWVSSYFQDRYWSELMGVNTSTDPLNPFGGYVLVKDQRVVVPNPSGLRFIDVFHDVFNVIERA